MGILIFSKAGGRTMVISSDEFGDAIAAVIWNEL